MASSICACMHAQVRAPRPLYMCMYACAGTSIATSLYVHACMRRYEHRDLSRAAVVVQQQYRERLGRRLARVRRQALERKAQLDEVAPAVTTSRDYHYWPLLLFTVCMCVSQVARARRHLQAACTITAQYRGFLVRRALRDATSLAFTQEQRKKSEQEIALKARSDCTLSR